MNGLEQQVAALPWSALRTSLHERGYARVPGLLPAATCNALSAGYEESGRFRKTVVMERYRFGLGQYRYFSYPLPESIALLRHALYARLVPVANTWMDVLGKGKPYPETLDLFRAQCHAAGQPHPTCLQLRYGPGGFNTMHQDLYGDLFFPIQAVLFLKDPVHDYRGGEFVLTEQIPRAQSKVIVLQPGQGDLLLFTTSFRPVKGSRGYYRVVMKHGVSEVTEGERETLGIIFHDAAT
ncbi:prolyl 4-hydroxylase subunit alpha [Pedobacter yulinensis]|uniref:Prolyl 4-hydroxylase subunit alpha n=1 Tax=Pedobacter yulinensis TaxID=2126353 RepID=A0A2T3HQX2_9SPHI|nr:2OG-Fe(II) oxygenase [Pedobacter yulinensis]PST84787.1 prolyl 4-hydroxylase subunit alpha [Pedobacter yulinensis]